MRTTHTLAHMEVSKATFDEIKGKLEAASYDHAILHDRQGQEIVLDMTGIGIILEGSDT